MTVNNCPYSLPCPVTTYRNMVAYFKWPAKMTFVTFKIKPGASMLYKNSDTEFWFDNFFGVFKDSSPVAHVFDEAQTKKLMDDLDHVAATYPKCNIKQEHMGDDLRYTLRPGSCQQLRDVLDSYLK